MRKRYGILLVCCAICALCYHFSVFSQVQWRFSDKIFQHPNWLEGNISVIGIDPHSLQTLGPFQTWSRKDMAKAIECLNADSKARPSVIGIDVMYYGTTEEAQDQALADVCARYDNVVVANNVVFQEAFEQKREDYYVRNPHAITMVEEPYEALRKVTKQGHINTLADEDGAVRHHLYRIDLPDGKQLTSFAGMLYEVYAKDHGIPVVEPVLDAQNNWYIPYTGKPGAYYDYFSFSDLLSGELKGEMFADTAVLIGAYAPGLMDSYMTPISSNVPMYGVEIHANVLDALLRHQWKQPVPVLWQIFISMVLLALVEYSFHKIKIYFVLPVLLLECMLFWFGCYELYNLGYLWNVLYVPIAMGLVALGVFLQKYVAVFWERRRIVTMFKRYLEPKVVDQLLKSGTQITNLGGTNQEISCFFVDIRGFTRLSECLSPNEVVQVLNEYFEVVTQCVFRYEGTLDKFIGDAAMAIFNAPLPVEDYAYQSVCAAWDILQGCEKISKHCEEKYGYLLQCGIGINCGVAVVGNIGTPNRMDYTAIGNTVNVAARLESIAKSGEILISKAVYDQIKHHVEAESIGKILLKGKTEPIEVFSVEKIQREWEVRK